MKGESVEPSRPKVKLPTVWVMPLVMMRPPLLPYTERAVSDGSLPFLPRYTRVKEISVGPQYVFAALIFKYGKLPEPFVMWSPPSVPLLSSGSIPFSQTTGKSFDPLLK